MESHSSFESKLCSHLRFWFFFFFNMYERFACMDVEVPVHVMSTEEGTRTPRTEVRDNC